MWTKRTAPPSGQRSNYKVESIKVHTVSKPLTRFIIIIFIVVFTLCFFGTDPVFHSWSLFSWGGFLHNLRWGSLTEEGEKKKKCFIFI